METVQYVQRLPGLGRDDFQVGLPHVAADKTQPFHHLRPQCLQPRRSVACDRRFPTHSRRRQYVSIW
jgi:hypothetical protein